MSRLYVYGVLPAEASIVSASVSPGLGNLPVECLAGRAMAALVSEGVPEPITATRRNMLGHTAVLERAMGGSPLLPVRFATLAPDREKLIACLDGHADAFAAALEKVAGRVELGVKASWCEGAMPVEALQADPGLTAWRDRLAVRPAAETYYERIELGRRVETTLSARRQLVAQEITGILAPLAERSVELRLLDDDMILNQAFLVRGTDERAFDAAVERLVARFSERVRFRYIGPVPPYNFVDLRGDWLAPNSATRN
jgi:hypothetical protein